MQRSNVFIHVESVSGHNIFRWRFQDDYSDRDSLKMTLNLILNRIFGWTEVKLHNNSWVADKWTITITNALSLSPISSFK